jgi:hypothetical protein
MLFIYTIRLASNEIFSPSNKIHREIGRAKDLSALRYVYVSLNVCMYICTYVCMSAYMCVYYIYAAVSAAPHLIRAAEKALQAS